MNSKEQTNWKSKKDGRKTLIDYPPENSSTHFTAISTKPLSIGKKYVFSMKIEEYVSRPYLLFGIANEKYYCEGGRFFGTSFLYNSRFLCCDGQNLGRNFHSNFNTKAVQFDNFKQPVEMNSGDECKLLIELSKTKKIKMKLVYNSHFAKEFDVFQIEDPHLCFCLPNGYLLSIQIDLIENITY